MPKRDDPERYIQLRTRLLGAARSDPASPPPPDPPLVCPETFAVAGRVIRVPHIATLAYDVDDATATLTIRSPGQPDEVLVLTGGDAQAALVLMPHVFSWKVYTAKVSAIGSNGVDHGPGTKVCRFSLTNKNKRPSWLKSRGG